MEIIQILKHVATHEPDVVVIVGTCTKADATIMLNPKPDDPNTAFVIKDEDIAEGPFDFESNTAPYSRDDVKGVKVKKNSTITFKQDGNEHQVTLTPDTATAHELYALGPSARTETQCIGLVLLECGTAKFLGPCLFGWGCS